MKTYLANRTFTLSALALCFLAACDPGSIDEAQTPEEEGANESASAAVTASATTSATTSASTTTAPVVPPVIASIDHQSNGQVLLHCTGAAGQKYTVQATADFITWTTLGMVTAASDGTFTYLDVAAASQSSRFYRLLAGSPHKLYVANYYDGTVSAVDTLSSKVVATIAVGTGPERVTISPDGSTAWVSNATANTVSVISISTNTVSATIAVGNTPDQILLSADGTTAYVDNVRSNSVSIINTASKTVSATVSVGTLSRAMALSPDGKTLYVGDTLGNIFAMNTSTHAVNTVTRLQTFLNHLAVSANGAYLYAENSYSLWTVSTSTHATLSTVTVGSSTSINPSTLLSATANNFTVSADGAYIYVTRSGNATNANAVLVVSTKTNAIVATWLGLGLPTALALSPDSATAYVTNDPNGAKGSISIVSTATGAVSGSIAVGTGAVAVAIY